MRYLQIEGIVESQAGPSCLRCQTPGRGCPEHRTAGRAARGLGYPEPRVVPRKLVVIVLLLTGVLASPARAQPVQLIPVVVGEILAGVVVGRTGFGWLDTHNVTVSFLGAPIWLILAVLASILMILGRKKKPLIGYARDRS